MSNFICPTCGFNNIDCGKDGYKTDREIELEKKLEIAKETLEWIEEQADTSTQYDYDAEAILKNIVFDAQQALKEINQLKDLLKQCIPAVKFAKDEGLAYMINKALNGESEGK